MKVKTPKGFTLAELLIVMAIITVLAAVAIPTFGKQLETARESSDVEAIRAALADAFHDAYVDYINNGTVDKDTPYTAAITFTQTKDGFNFLAPKYTVGSATITLKNGASDETLVVEGDSPFTYVGFFFDEEDGNGGIKLDDITAHTAAPTKTAKGTSLKKT